MPVTACGLNPAEVGELLRREIDGDGICPACGLRPADHAWRQCVIYGCTNEARTETDFAMPGFGITRAFVCTDHANPIAPG